ncbi:Outer membrane porin protein [Paraburkholderia caffeinitolerans]|uniref:Outer membrane porin protein n=1 Tax=Paraburkholderia caffeinitolerans TaxID=1723730 RepID=A0A6J5G4T7_9BURK|nr:porin [Paraburkholderia caffeinitolerans]CAB3792080.1 Outer membrane porin protein [Paraburkholderia caffeinitolerans]
MKKSLIALALTGAFAGAAHAQSSVTLYGLIDAGLVYTNNQLGHSSWQLSSSPTQNSVFGLKGSEDLGGGLHALFKIEQSFMINNGAQAFAGSMFGSQAWVGLQSDPYGTLTFGRQFDVMNDLVGPLTAEWNTWGGSLAGHPFENDNLSANSVVFNNTVKYASPTWNGLTFETMYAFSNKAGNFANNRAYGFAVSYAQGPVNLAAGYLQANGPGNGSGAITTGDTSADFIAQRQRIWSLGGNYTYGPVTAGLVWSHTQIDNAAGVFAFGSGTYLGAGDASAGTLGGSLRLDNYEANLKYALTPAWTVSGAYTYTHGAYNGSAPGWNTAMLQTAYAISKRTDFYVEGVYQNVHGAPQGSVLSHAMINTLSPSSTQTQVAVAAGMRHAF